MGRGASRACRQGRGRGLIPEYHRLTAHHPGGRPRTDPRLVAGFQPMEIGRQPPQFKKYEQGLPTVVLPSELAPGSIARLLFLSAGVVRGMRLGNRTLWFRAAGSAGNLGPVEVYVVCGDGPELSAGVYHYEPLEHALTRLGSVPADLPTSLVLTGVPWRTGWKYGERGFRHLWWDAGTMLSQMLEVAAADGRDPTVSLGFVDADVAAIVGAERPHELPLAVMGLDGCPELPMPPERPPPSGSTAEEPLEFPLVTEAYEAGEIEADPAVGAWRDLMASAGRPAPSPEATSQPEMPVEEVIRRRGSTREFDARGEVGSAQLAQMLSWAGRSVPADFVGAGRSLVETHVLVHIGGEPGHYELTAAGLAPGSKTLGDHRSSRSLGRYLCLNQDLGGSGILTAFHGADLDRLVSRGGARAWRAAHLEAGIVSGRLHLAAVGRGLGATGLTFFDEEVRRNLGIPPLLATAVGLPGYRSRKGGRPRTPTLMRG